MYTVCLFIYYFSVGVGYVLSVSLVSQCKDVASTDRCFWVFGCQDGEKSMVIDNPSNLKKQPPGQITLCVYS